MTLDNPSFPETLGQASEAFSIDEIARLPSPGMAIPTRITFSPDGRLIAFLWSQEGSLTQQLYAFHLDTGEIQLLVSPPEGGTTDENVSLEEALRRERARQREFGVTSYEWARNTNHLLIPIQGDLYIQASPVAPLQKIFSSQGKPVLDPHFSPDGSKISFVQDSEIYILPVSGGKARQITTGARGSGKTHGLAEYIAQEEMARSRGYWWSPDSQWIAFEEVDETHIPVYRIVHQGKDATGESAQEDHRYPFAGTPNARVRLGVVPAAGGDPAWMDLGSDKDIYLARVNWLPDGRLAAQVENREQSSLELRFFDHHTGRGQVILQETSAIWINLNDLFRPLEKGGFIWGSERSGYRHLYLYNLEGHLLRQLTSGDWMVDDIVGVDEQQQKVFFTSTQASPLECQLYSVSYEGEEPQRITLEPGWHSAVLNPDCTLFVDTFHNLQIAPVINLRSLGNGATIAPIFGQIDPRVEEIGLEPPELISIKNRHGDTLHAAIYRPPSRYGMGPFPTIVYVYGGPHAQLVTNGWSMTSAMRPQYLRGLGFLVFVLDNRGSARRGLEFESQIKHDMGHLEVEDQEDGVQWLVQEGLADPDRVGVYGWSYGGYMTLMCLARAPETFKVGVAGAPVTSWDGYDTHYTERYMGTPDNNPKGYENSSVMQHVTNLQGKLLLVHGMIDENVHFRHAARLINALIRARKPYDLLLFPDERHMPRRPADRIYMEQLIRDYFIKHLMSKQMNEES